MSTPSIIAIVISSMLVVAYTCFFVWLSNKKISVEDIGKTFSTSSITSGGIVFPIIFSVVMAGLSVSIGVVEGSPIIILPIIIAIALLILSYSMSELRKRLHGYLKFYELTTKKLADYKKEIVIPKIYSEIKKPRNNLYIMPIIGNLKQASGYAEMVKRFKKYESFSYEDFDFKWQKIKCHLFKKSEFDDVLSQSSQDVAEFDKCRKELENAVYTAIDFYNDSLRFIRPICDLFESVNATNDRRYILTADIENLNDSVFGKVYADSLVELNSAFNIACEEISAFISECSTFFGEDYNLRMGVPDYFESAIARQDMNLNSLKTLVDFAKALKDEYDNYLRKIEDCLHEIDDTKDAIKRADHIEYRGYFANQISDIGLRCESILTKILESKEIAAHPHNTTLDLSKTATLGLDVYAIEELLERVKDLHSKIDKISIQSNSISKRFLATKSKIGDLEKEVVPDFDVEKCGLCDDEAISTLLDETLKIRDFVISGLSSIGKVLKTETFEKLVYDSVVSNISDEGFMENLLGQLGLSAFEKDIKTFKDKSKKLKDEMAAYAPKLLRKIYLTGNSTRMKEHIKESFSELDKYRDEHGRNILHIVFSEGNPDRCKTKLDILNDNFGKHFLEADSNMLFPIDMVPYEWGRIFIASKAHYCTDPRISHDKSSLSMLEKQTLVMEILAPAAKTGEQKINLITALASMRYDYEINRFLDPIYKAFDDTYSDDYRSAYKECYKFAYLIPAVNLGGIESAFNKAASVVDEPLAKAMIVTLRILKDVQYCNTVRAYFDKQTPEMIVGLKPNTVGCIAVAKALATLTSDEITSPRAREVINEIIKKNVKDAIRIYDAKPSKELFGYLKKLDPRFSKGRSENQEYLSILDLPYDATEEDVSRAYKKKLIQYKKSGAPQEKILELNRVYSEVLRK